MYQTNLQHPTIGTNSRQFNQPDVYEQRWQANRTQGVITLSGLLFNYAQFKTNAVTSGKLQVINNQFKDKSGLDYIFEDFPFVNKILSTSQYWFDTATNTYNPISSRNTYNYNSAITLSTEKLEIVNATITVFPNPTTSMVNLAISTAVTIDKVVVVDVTGKTVLQQNQNTTQVNV